MKTTYKTTDRQYKIFIAECKKWIKYFGLLGWKFYYQHEDRSDMFDAGAYCINPTKSENRNFTLGLSVSMGTWNISDDEVKEYALHEVLEAFLWKFQYIAECRYCQPEEIEEEKHNIIRTLEHILIKDAGK